MKPQTSSAQAEHGTCKLVSDDKTPARFRPRAGVLQEWQSSYAQTPSQSNILRPDSITIFAPQLFNFPTFKPETDYAGSPNTNLSSSIEVIQASEWIGTPKGFKTSRPPSKSFSINAPMPTIFEPDASARRANPKIVCPLARKSSMIKTFSPFAKYSGETINSTMRPFVCEGASVKYT